MSIDWCTCRTVRYMFVCLVYFLWFLMSCVLSDCLLFMPSLLRLCCCRCYRYCLFCCHCLYFFICCCYDNVDVVGVIVVAIHLCSVIITVSCVISYVVIVLPLLLLLSPLMFAFIIVFMLSLTSCRFITAVILCFYTAVIDISVVLVVVDVEDIVAVDIIVCMHTIVVICYTCIYTDVSC